MDKCDFNCNLCKQKTSCDLDAANCDYIDEVITKNDCVICDACTQCIRVAGNGSAAVCYPTESE
jgi:hypothetical protein